jgi:hypothetical protein
MSTQPKKRLVLILLGLSIAMSIAGHFLVTRSFTVEFEYFVYPHDYAAAHIFSVDAEGFETYDVYINGRLCLQNHPIDWSFGVVSFGTSANPILGHNLTVVVHDQVGETQQRTYFVMLDEDDYVDVLYMFDLEDTVMSSITALCWLLFGIIGITEFSPNRRLKKGVIADV